METKSMPQMLSIKELKEKYRSKKLTPEKLIQNIIERSEVDKAYNIWIIPPALDHIQPYLDRLKAMAPEQSPLWGIPFAIKDNIDLAGVPTTAGCKEFSYISEENATVVKRLVEAGAIPVGKTNLDQFATGLVGTRSPYGETKNALKPELISGGSSSGSAVAVARGLAAFSLGTDTAGSGRVPAGLNRLIGYKPSVGAWSVKGVVPACASLDCVSVFANSLEDVELVDQVVRGFDDLDQWSRVIRRLPNALPERVYLLSKLPAFFGSFADDYKKAWGKTVERLGQLNIPIEYIDGGYFFEAAEVLYGGPWIAERWADLGDFIMENEGACFPVTEEVLMLGAKPEYNAASVFKAMHKLQGFKHMAHKQLDNSVLIMPTTGGTWTRVEVRENAVETNSQMGIYTNHCNLLDLCAVNIPGEDAGENLPFGITLFSSCKNEHLIFGLADLFLNGRNSRLLESNETTVVAVCGLHMRGFPLEKQMLEHGAVFIREAITAPKYKIVKLPTEPSKPGLIQLADSEQGSSFQLELWAMPLTEFGSFAAQIPSPLGIGKVILEDGSQVPGFLCESYAAKNAQNISHLTSWRDVGTGSLSQQKSGTL